MTRQEFDAGYDGMHVPLTCENHPDLRWSCKRIAISFDKDGIGRYNQQRSIFFVGELKKGGGYTDRYEECECPTSKLKLIFEEEKVLTDSNPSASLEK